MKITVCDSPCVYAKGSPAFFIFPKTRGEHDEQREHFQASQQHGKAKDTFGKVGKTGIRTGGADDTKAGADRTHGRNTDTDGVEHADAIGR